MIYSFMDAFVLVFCIIIYCRSMAPSTTTTFSLRTVLEKDKLNRNNYADWIRNLRIVLRAEKRKTFLITPYQKN